MGTTESVLYEEPPPASTELHPSSSQEPPSSPRSRRQISEALQHPRRRSAKTKPIKRINGLVLGGPSTGKRTLLQRLEGNDPYAETNEPQEAPSSITIPYMPPPETPTWDRVQLHVQSSRKVQEKVDFAVLMLSPRHDLENTRAYIFNVLTSFLVQLGYRQKLNGADDDKQDANRSEEPVCICILFNFCDLQESIPQQEIKNIVEEILQPVPREKVVLQFASTCLRNCYGLSVLHNFIYRTYLQRKRTDLEAQLKEVGAQIGVTEEPPSMSYEDFLKLLGPSKQPSQIRRTTQNNNHPIVDPTHDSDSSEHSPESSSPQQQQQQQQHQQAAARSIPPQSRAAANGRPVRGGPRRLYRPEKKPVRVGKEALEAFLASDSEEDEAPVLTKKKSPNTESSDDDDDDFFYDEKGKRRFNHLTFKNQEAETSSSDGDTEEEPNEAPVRRGRKAKKQLSKAPPRVVDLQKSGEGKIVGKKMEPSRTTQMPGKPKMPPKHDDMATKDQSPITNTGESIEAQGVPKGRVDLQKSVEGKTVVKKMEPSRTTQMPDKPKMPPTQDDMEDQLPVTNTGESIEAQGVPKGDEEVSRVQIQTRSDVADSDSKGDDTPPGVTEEPEASEMESYEQYLERVERDEEGEGETATETPGEPSDVPTTNTSMDSEEDNTKTDEDETNDVGLQQVPEGSEAPRGEKTEDESVKHTSLPATNVQSPLPGEDAGDDDEFFVETTEQQNADQDEDEEERGPTTSNSSKPPPQPEGIAKRKTNPEDSDDDDDDDFIIESTSPLSSYPPEESDNEEVVIDNSPSEEKAPPKVCVTKTEQADSDEEEFFVGEESRPQPPTKSVPQDIDSDEDEFFVGEETTQQERPGTVANLPQTPLQHAQGGAPLSAISPAAFAAIAAAQKEAEAMLLQPNAPHSTGDHRKPKKAKKKKEEKKKKKKKEKKSSD